MDKETKKGHRLKIANEPEPVPKTKGKEKARKELWDSLCAVYENEADKENGDIDISELEEWTVTNPETKLRGLSKLVVINPEIISAAAFPGNPEILLENELEEKGVGTKNLTKDIKGENVSSNTDKKSRCKSSYMKTVKRLSPVKKCKVPRQVSQKDKLSVSLMKRNLEDKKSKCFKKPKEQFFKDEESEIRVQKKERKNKLSHLKDTLISSGQSTKLSKGSTKLRKEQLQIREGDHSSHMCELEYRSYLKTKNASTRHDKRVLNCKLIFKVCYCYESDVVL